MSKMNRKIFPRLDRNELVSETLTWIIFCHCLKKIAATNEKC